MRELLSSRPVSSAPNRQLRYLRIILMDSKLQSDNGSGLAPTFMLIIDRFEKISLSESNLELFVMRYLQLIGVLKAIRKTK
jgi:hypothetical protein